MQAHGLLSQQSYGEAFEIFQLLSRDCYAPADHFLAWMYEQGLGTEKDEKKAFDYYMFSAKAGDGVSQYGVGMYYLEGTAVEQNSVKAYYWFSLSAQLAEQDPDSECGAKAELKKLANKLTNEQLIEAQRLLKP
jgi:TPR repeat protein